MHVILACMLIATANSKGGVGKTTLAVHLADWLSLYGYRAILVDCDAQRLSSRWLSAARPGVDTLVLDSPQSILRTLPELHDEYEAVVVDAPGGLGKITGAIFSEVDAVLIPTGPSNLDIMALDWAVRTIHEVQVLRNGAPQTVIIPLKANAGRITTQNLMDKARLHGFGITKTSVPYREIYVQVSGLEDRPPKLLWQLGKSKRVRQAALELDALFQEVFPEACEDGPSKIIELVTRIRRPENGEIANSP